MSWPEVELENVCRRVTDGTHQSPRFESEGVPFLVIKDVISGRICWDGVAKWVSEATYDEHTARCRPERGDVLYTAVGSFGVAVPVETDKRFMFQRHIAHIKPDPDEVSSSYLSHVLNGPELRRVAESVAKGVAQQTVTLGDLKKFRIPLPPLPEQKRIAAILDKADEIRRKRAEAIKLTEELLRSAFLEMFGDPVTNPKGWEVKAVGDVVDFLTSGSRGWAKYYSEEGAKFLRIQNIGYNQLLTNDLAYVEAPDSAESKRTQVAPGDIVLSITADLGRTAVIPDGFGAAHINQHLCLLRLKDGAIPIFVSQYLASTGGQRQIERLNRGGVKSGLNFDDVRGLEVPMPPVRLQLQFANFHTRVQNRLRMLRGLETDERFLISSLTQRAFRGEL